MATTWVASSPKSAWGSIIKVSFIGNQGIRKGSPNVLVSDGVPDEANPVGTLVWDVTNSDGYICTVATGTYVKINA